MGGEVYADLLFLVNFSMDFLCFYLTARFLHRPLSLWRGVLASTLGGVYAVAALFLSVGRVPAYLIDAGVCIGLCSLALASRRERVRSLVRLCGVYLLISMLLGGVMTALFSQLNRIPGLTDQVAEEGLSTWIFFALAVVSALLTALGGKSVRRAAARRRVTVIIREKGAQLELEALCDTGNLLRDPISGKPVIPVESEKLRDIFPAALLRAVQQPDRISMLPAPLSRRVRLIPARGATGERLMVAFLPECVLLREGDEEHAVAALIAPAPLGQSKEGIFALVPSELMLS